MVALLGFKYLHVELLLAAPGELDSFLRCQLPLRPNWCSIIVKQTDRRRTAHSAPFYEGVAGKLTANIASAAAVDPAPDSDIGSLQCRPSAAAGQLVPAAGKAFDSISSKEVMPLELCPSDAYSAAREALKQRKRRHEGERKKKADKKKGFKEQIVRQRWPREVWRRLVERDQKCEELEQEVLSWRAQGPKLLKLQCHNKILTQSVATLEKQLGQCNK